MISIAVNSAFIVYRFTTQAPLLVTGGGGGVTDYSSLEWYMYQPLM